MRVSGNSWRDDDFRGSYYRVSPTMVYRNHVKKDNRTEGFLQKYLGGHFKAEEEGCDGDHGTAKLQPLAVESSYEPNKEDESPVGNWEGVVVST